MRDLTKSILSFSWVMSLFGLRQMGAVFAPGTGTTSAFDKITRCTEDQLGTWMRSTFRAGDSLQRGLVDMMFGFLTLGSWDPNSVVRMGADVMSRTAQAGVSAMQGSVQAAGQAAQAAGWTQPSGQQPSAGWGPMPPTGA